LVVDVEVGMQVANNFVLNGNGTIQVGATFTTTFLGDISGAGNLINQSDGGTLVLSGNNTHATTTINGGVLAVTNGAAIANTGTVILADAAGATLTVQDSETIGSLRGGGATGGGVIIASGQTLTVAETGSQTFAGIIGDAGGLAKTGVGTLTLTGTNTSTGPTSVTGGHPWWNRHGRCACGAERRDDFPREQPGHSFEWQYDLAERRQLQLAGAGRGWSRGPHGLGQACHHWGAGPLQSHGRRVQRERLVARDLCGDDW
jgi:autotransporter-associated beta strand protein